MTTARALSALTGYLSLTDDSPSTPPARDSEWVEVIALANAHLLGATLFEALRQGRRDGELPADVRDYLALLREMNGRRNEALRAQAREILEVFGAAGITPLLLKGGATLLDPEDPLHQARMMRDLDILVPHRAQDAAVALLRDLGYRVHERYPPDHHAYGEFARDGAAGTVDLHTELIDPSYLLPAQELRQRARPLANGESAVLIPAPTDRILHHLLHAQIHHRGQFYRGELRLDQLYDFAALSHRFAGEIDWRFIEHRLAAHRLSLPLQSYLLAAGHLFGLPWPLASEPEFSAKRHFRRCLLQLRHPALGRMLSPIANLRGAFAWHRMQALYGDHGGAARHRLRHAQSFIKKATLRQALDRVFR